MSVSPSAAELSLVLEQVAAPVLIVAAEPELPLLFANLAARQLLAGAGAATLAALLGDGAARRELLGLAEGDWRYRELSVDDRRLSLELAVRRLSWGGAAALQLDLREPREAPELLYRQMFQTNPAVKLLIDPEHGIIVDANPAAEAFYGYSLEQLRGMEVAAINVLDQAEIQRRMAAARAARRLFFEFRHRLASGELRDVHVYTGPVTVAGRDYLHSIIFDVTAEKHQREQLEVYRDLFYNLPIGLYRNTPGRRGRFIAANPAMLEIFDAATEEELFAHSIQDFYQDPGQRQAFSDEVLAEGGVRRRELALRTVTGRSIWVAITARRSEEADGSPVLDGILEDITARKQAETLRDQLIHLLEASPDLVSITDGEQRVVYLNAAGRRLVGELPGGLPEALQRVHPPWAARRIREEAIPTAQRKGHWDGDSAVITRDGRELPMSQLVVIRRDANGRLDCIGTIMRDISESKRQQAELEFLAGHDRLTQTLNRMRLEQHLEDRCHGSESSLIMFDLDHFKRVNDDYGHAAGDLVLQEVAARVRAELRESDLLGRWGGEEFMVLLPDASAAAALEVAERLRRAVVAGDYAPVPRVSCSFGVAQRRGGESNKDWLRRVDQALYAAKAAGRNCVRVAIAGADDDPLPRRQAGAGK